jgi:hypothetical protein
VALLHDTACKKLTKFIIIVNNIQQIFQRFPEAPISYMIISPKLKFPEKIRIDRVLSMADEEITIHVNDFEILEE